MKERLNERQTLDFFDPKEFRIEGLRGRFVLPPFSVFRAISGEWARRKRMWLSLGIQSEVGRGGDIRIAPDGTDTHSIDKKIAYGKDFAIGNKTEWEKSKTGAASGIENGSGTSVFDPVLSELIYRWFCPRGGQIVDPFAGGSVRGIVASVLGHRYWGVELRPEQVDANRRQAEEIVPDDVPTWVCADARQVLHNSPRADLIFSCPPYGNLEVYSDLPGDLSNMEYPAFRRAYLRIVRLAVERLRQNRFACFVVGNFRGRDGFYHDFVSDTVKCFRKAGANFYNEAILITAAGSLPIRVARQFQASRKLGKTHQNVLVFYKGDPSKIKGIFGDVPCD